MAKLSTRLTWELAQTKWAAQINPILALPILQGNQIDEVVLTATTPQAINHGLQRLPQGWFLVDKNANANVWRTQPFNTATLTLESSANVTVDIYVY